MDDLAVLCRDELGTDRCVEDVVERTARRGVAARLGIVADDISDQRLGHGRVDAVHRHVIAVVGRPTQRNFGQVACADDYAAAHIGDVHQHLRALSRLRVLVRHVGQVDGVIDVRKMDLDRLAYLDLFEVCAQPLCERLGVGASTRRRTEARHRHRKHVFGRKPRYLRRVYGDQKRKRAVKPSRQPDDHFFGARVRYPLCKRIGLYREDQFAPPLSALVVDGHERRTRRLATELGLGEFALKFDLSHSDRRAEGIARSPLSCQFEHVDDSDRRTFAERRALGEHRRVLGNDVVACKHRVRRALADAGVRIDIAAQPLARRRAHEQAAIFRLADDLIARGRVAHDRRARRTQLGRRRLRTPHVLADLDAETKLGHALATEQQVGAERNDLRSDARLFRDRVLCRREISALIEFTVIGDRCLGDDADHPAAVQHDSAIVQFAVRPDGRAYDDRAIALRRLFGDREQRRVRRVEQRVLREQVRDGIAGHRHLGEHDQFAALRRIFGGKRGDRVRIERGIGDFARRSERRDFDETVFHIHSLPHMRRNVCICVRGVVYYYSL